MEKMQNLEMLRMVEAALAQHRAFGDSDYIHEQLGVCYRRRLDKIAAALPAAARLARVLSDAGPDLRRQMIGDTVLRCTIQHALRQVETGLPYGLPLEQCAQVFEAAIRHVGEGRSGGPLLDGLVQAQRLGPHPYNGWVWNEEHADDDFGRAFRFVIRENYDGPLCTPSADELAMLERGAQLLQSLLPLLSSSALSHVQLIAVFPRVGVWNGKASSSQFRVGGTIFLNRDLLGNPWWLAEHLLHESLHQKLYDFRHAHSLLETDFAREEAPRMCSLWNVTGPDKGNYWDAHRAIAAFHVYVHLALLCALAEEQAPGLEPLYGSPQGPMTGSRRAIDRARYLGEQIHQVCWQEMGVAGRSMVDWLVSVLDVLDPAPRAPGSYLHLLLDLYQRQSKKAASFLKKAAADLAAPVAAPDLADGLGERLVAEVEATRAALAAADSGDELARFNDRLGQWPNADPRGRFLEVRTRIADALGALSERGVETSGAAGARAGALVKEMVQQSCAGLAALGMLA